MIYRNNQRINFGFRSRTRGTDQGFTIIEIIFVLLILSILTAAAIPMLRNSVRRQREVELRISLRQIRQAIDAYKRYSDMTAGAAIPVQLRTQTGYPKNLEILTEGFTPTNTIGTSGNKIRFLRRIPIDPMTGEANWLIRSYKDDPDSFSSNPDDAYDIRSASEAMAMNGTYYKDW